MYTRPGCPFSMKLRTKLRLARMSGSIRRLPRRLQCAAHNGGGLNKNVVSFHGVNVVDVTDNERIVGQMKPLARSVADAGLTFVGPTPAAIDLMGDKVRARAFVNKHGFPVAPSAIEDDDPATFVARGSVTTTRSMVLT